VVVEGADDLDPGQHAQAPVEGARGADRVDVGAHGEWSPGAVASVAGSIIDAGMADRTLVQSFAPGTLAHLRDIAPMVERCLLRTVPREEDMAVVEELQAIAYNPSVRGFFLRRAVVDQFLDSGCGVFVWTVDDSASWEKLLGAGVQGIITNRPATLQGFITAKFEALP
jgi:glycerophosphoryl diester phosphodiesterase